MDEMKKKQLLNVGGHKFAVLDRRAAGWVIAHHDVAAEVDDETLAAINHGKSYYVIEFEEGTPRHALVLEEHVRVLP